MSGDPIRSRTINVQTRARLLEVMNDPTFVAWTYENLAWRLNLVENDMLVDEIAARLYDLGYAVHRDGRRP